MARNDLAQVVILDGEFQAGAGLELPDVVPVKLLPGRMIDDFREFQRSAATRDLLIRKQHIDPSLFQVDFNLIASAKDGQVAANGRLGRNVQDGRAVGSPALPSIAHAWQHADALADKPALRRHGDHYRGAWITHR